MEIDQAIDRLIDAVAGAGGARPRPPATTADLDEISRQVSPMVLPGEVRRFWERIDVATFGLLPFYEFKSPEDALEDWTSTRANFPELTPASILPFANESRWYLGVELDQQGIDGGTIFEWHLETGTLTRTFNSVSLWLIWIVEQIEQGVFERSDWLGIPTVQLGLDWETIPTPPPRTHTVYGDKTEFDPRIDEWPEHWKSANALTPEVLQSRGPTHRIAQILEADHDETVHATLRGKVESWLGNAETMLVLVTDGSGAMVIECPRSELFLLPTIGGTYEFDVVAEPGPRTGVAEYFADFSGEAEVGFLASHPQRPEATALAVRHTGA